MDVKEFLSSVMDDIENDREYPFDINNLEGLSKEELLAIILYLDTRRNMAYDLYELQNNCKITFDSETNKIKEIKKK